MVPRGLSTPCFYWTGPYAIDGYGLLWWKGRQRRAHRLMWELFRGEIPAGMVVCHKCDVRHCVNLEHLFVGTTKDNNQDCMAKGRHVHGDAQWQRKYPERRKRGVLHWNAKLTPELVRQIREYAAKGKKPTAIGALLGLTRYAVQDVIRGRSWRHV